MPIDELLRCKSWQSPPADRAADKPGVSHWRCMKWKGHSGPHVAMWRPFPAFDAADMEELLATASMVGQFWYDG